jgi:excisionase family DNA binding protein
MPQLERIIPTAKPSPPPAEQPPCLVWKVPEVATQLGVEASTIYRLIRAKQLPALRVGRRVVVPKVALARYLEGG